MKMTAAKGLRYFLLALCLRAQLACGQSLAHFIGEQQRQVDSDDHSLIASYELVHGKLVPDKKLLLTVNLVQSAIQLGNFLFINYDDLSGPSIRVFDLEAGVLSEPANSGTTVFVDYSDREDGSVCANWPEYAEPMPWTKEKQNWAGHPAGLVSFCAVTKQKPRIYRNEWEQIKGLVWPGSYVGNVQTCLLHVHGQDAIPAVIGSAPVAIASIPHELLLNLPRGVIAVAGANKSYLVVESLYSVDNAVYVLDRKRNIWSTIRISASSFRIFGQYLVGFDQACDDPSQNKEQRLTCVPTALRVVSLADGSTTELPKATDSEVLAIDADLSMIHREGTDIYKTHLGQPLDRSRDLLVRAEVVKTIHWAY